MQIQEMVKSFVENIVMNLVDDKDEVLIKTEVSTKSILVQIKTSKEDCGKVIGRKGRTIDALKIITLAAKNTNFPGDSKSVSIEILEENFDKQKKNMED